MNRECIQKFLSGFFVFCIALSFSFASFSAPFTGAYMTTEIDPVTGIPTTVIKDVNPTGQTYSGQNVVEMNAYNNAPVLTNNTFNGSTDINPDFTSITSSGNAYNGSVDINYDGLGGTLDSNGDRFQSTTVTAQQSDISISNGTFNGTTNINAQSVSLGSITQMDDLVCNLMLFKELMFTNQYVYAINSTPAASSITVSYGSASLTQALPYHSYFLYKTDGTYDTYRYRAGFLRSILIDLDLITENMFSILTYNFDRLITAIKGRNTYLFYNFSPNGEYFNLTSSSQTLIFYDAVTNRLDTIIGLLQYYCDKYYQWFYPLDNTAPEYWRYYNTDTAQQESIGLAGLMYNISWYLGQMYVLQSASQSLDNMTDQVEAITDTLEEAEQKENAVISSISSGINSFAPDLTEIGEFRALSWTSNYLQQVFLALGTYGTVILVGLLLGVCMQFIGYFRYK